MALKFSKLTRPAMRKLQTSQTITEHGIRFERLANGDGKFSVNIMVDGQRVHRVVGKESDGVTRQQAEEFIQQAKSDARKGRLNLPKGRKTVLGLSQAADNYITKLEEEGGRGIGQKMQQLRDHLKPFFKDTSLKKISSFDVERFKKARLESATAGTVNRDLAVLSHLFSKSVEWGWIDFKPAKIKRLKLDDARITYLDTDQIHRLLESAKQDQNPQVFPFIMIGLETSMRKMEILSIRLEDLDIDRRTIFIPKAKAGSRTQPMTAKLAQFLKGHVESATPGQEWLFPAPKSKTGHTVSIEKPFRRVVENAGLDPKEVVRHTLRHTAISHLVQAGVDLPTVKRISGHKTLSMVERYSHQNGDHIQKAMDKLERRYQNGN
ncbi:MAG: site-specific integrase [Magnetococcales bacterium]|nr:site-specific integrase [Magnetococcales bacterium]